jgi:hypothetical protein
MDTFVATQLHVGGHLVALSFESQWPQVGVVIEWVADPNTARSVRHAFEEFIEDRTLGKNATPRNTDLTGRSEYAGDHPGSSVGDVGVVEDDVGRLAAKLQCRTNEATGSGGCDARARGRAPSERYLREPRVVGEVLTSFGPQPRDDVDRAGGKSRFYCEFGEAQDDRRGVF